MALSIGCSRQRCMAMSSLNASTQLEEELEATISTESVEKNMAFAKIKIPANLKPEVMRHLRTMNLTAATLFPGLDGIGRYLDDLVRYP